MMGLMPMVAVGIVVGLVLEALIVPLALAPYIAADDGYVRPLTARPTSAGIPDLLAQESMPRKILLVIITAVTFALVGAQYHGNLLHVSIVSAYIAVLIVCASTDTLAYRVANVVTYPAILTALIIGLVVPGAHPVGVLLGGLVYGGLLLTIALITDTVGLGSVKLALFVGLALGLSLAWRAMLLAAVPSVVVIAAVLSPRLRARGMPLAPFIAFGAVVTLLLWGTAFRSL